MENRGFGDILRRAGYNSHLRKHVEGQSVSAVG